VYAYICILPVACWSECKWESQIYGMLFVVVLDISNGSTRLCAETTVTLAIQPVIGADFNRTMVVTAPGEKLLIQFFSLFCCKLQVIIYRCHWCHSLQSAVSKPTVPSAATTAELFDSNIANSASEVTTLWRYTNLFIIIIIICTKSFFSWGFAPDPTGGAYSAPQTS